jgi:hypothetical protein
MINFRISVLLHLTLLFHPPNFPSVFGLTHSQWIAYLSTDEVCDSVVHEGPLQACNSLHSHLRFISLHPVCSQPVFLAFNVNYDCIFWDRLILIIVAGFLRHTRRMSGKYVFHSVRLEILLMISLNANVLQYVMQWSLVGRCQRFTGKGCLQGRGERSFRKPFRKANKKLKQSHYKPWQSLSVPGGWGPKILRQSAHEGGPRHRPLLPTGNIPGTHFC